MTIIMSNNPFTLWLLWIFQIIILKKVEIMNINFNYELDFY
jgi:hypothetical protein